MRAFTRSAVTRAPFGSPCDLGPGGAIIARNVGGAALRRPHPRGAVGRYRDRSGGAVRLRHGGRRLPRPAAIERVADVEPGMMMRRDSHPHHHLGFILGASDPGGVVEQRRLVGALRRRLVQVPMGKPAVIAHRAEQVRAFGGAAKFQWHGLFDARGHHAPPRGLLGIHVGQVERLPAAVAGGEHGVPAIRWVDFDIEHPVDWRARHVGRQERCRTCRRRRWPPCRRIPASR